MMIRIEELQQLAPGLADADLDQLKALEAAAVEFVQTQTRRYFGPVQDYEEILLGRGVRKLYLREAPVDDVPDDYVGMIVSVDERQYAGDDAIAIEDYELRLLEGEAVLVRLSGAVWTLDYEYTVTYRMGYEEGTEPADIRNLVVDLVASRAGFFDSSGLKSETLGGYSYTRFDASDLEDIQGGWATINAYRRLVVA